MSRTSDSKTAITNDNYRNNKFWGKKEEPKKTTMLEDLTLGQLMQIERCIYNSEFEFKDFQFREFIEQQLEFGIDPIEIELREEIIVINEVIYFFENLIAECDY